jgi:hypothetical protein
MNRIFIIAIIIISSIPGSQTFAQNKKEKKAKEEEKIPVYNYVIDDPMDAFGRTPAPQSTLLFPDFYSYNPIRKGDTLFRYLCYDRRDSLINVDTLQNIDLVRYISLFISYTDHDHNYKDAQGQILPLPVSKIIRRYDKLGTDKWMSIDYANNKYIELNENKSDITRTETVNIVHPITHTPFTRTHNYYRVSK